MKKKLEKAVRDQKKQVAPDVPQISGLLGIPINGQKTVEVPNRKAFVYVRLRNNQSEVIQAFNNKVSPAYGLPVKVIREGNRYTVLSVDTQRYENNWTSFAPFLPRHGNTHSFDIESGGGADIVWVYPRQFMPLLVLPSGSLGGQNVIVSPYTLKNDNGTWKQVGNTGTANLTTYNPSSATGAVIALVFLDTASGNPSLLINSGSIFSSAITGTNQIYPYIPTVTNPSTQIPLAAIRLVTGTSQISWDNIYDVRQFVHNQPTGSPGSGITSVAVQDEGAPQGNVTTFNFIGANVHASVSGSVARIFVTGSTGGSSEFVGTPSSAVLTNASGTLFTPAWLKWGTDAQEFLEFGADVAGKESNAGRMGYETFGAGYFFLIGAGTGTPDRNVMILDNLYVGSNLFAYGGQPILPFTQEATEDYVGGMFTGNQQAGITSTYDDTSGKINLDVQSSSDLRYGRIDGWQIHTGTWIRQSADTPTFVVSVSPYTQGIIFVGNKVDLFQSPQDKYFFVNKIEVSGSVGFLTLYGGTDYSLTTGSISAAKYSYDKSPAGFPTSPDKWTVSAITTGTHTKSSPTAGEWYGGSELSPTGTIINLPIGDWRVFYRTVGDLAVTLGAVTAIGMRVTLSTAENAESDPELTTSFTVSLPAGTDTQRATYQAEKNIAVTSKTTYYLNIFTGNSGVTSISMNPAAVFRNVIKAICAYL